MKLSNPGDGTDRARKVPLFSIFLSNDFRPSPTHFRPLSDCSVSADLASHSKFELDRQRFREPLCFLGDSKEAVKDDHSLVFYG